MLKRIISLILLILLLCPPSASAEISAASAVLLEPVTGRIIYEKNAHQRRTVASTTKIMTALLTAELCDPAASLKTTKEMVTVEGSSMGLREGDTVTVEGLIYGMLLASGNDAANTAAIYISGSLTEFAVLMNKKAREIGMKNTNFVTPSGLDAENQYSTAYDMALLAACAMKNQSFAEAAGSKTKTVEYGNPPYRRTLTNHNKLLSQYKGTTGIKTGFTKKSGRCLVSGAERDGVSLIAVTLNAPNDWDDHKKMLNEGFDKIKAFDLTTGIQGMAIPVAGGAEELVGVKTEAVKYIGEIKDSGDIGRRYILPQFVYAPVEEGDVLGRIIYHINGKEIARGSITAAESVETAPLTKKYYLKRIKFWMKILLSS